MNLVFNQESLFIKDEQKETLIYLSSGVISL